ncbi:MAG: peptide MFS transporter [Opitutaceae bacterium]|nr:peptide MFS transporter [Opitutaceae bacterium]MBP9911941.1 peptide MFS transporter [Opitutaceae bacterium]
MSLTAPSAAPVATAGLDGHPRGLTTLFFTEMWERFSYYGMRALLILFMVAAVSEGGLGFDTKRAAAIYGTYTMSVYLLSILGGFIADNFIGARRAVFIGGVIIACGHFSLACHSLPSFFAGLVLIALGTGLLKPNVSTMVGSLYAPGDERRDAGFSIFYMGINLGGFLAPLVTGFLAQHSWFKARLASWGFDPAHSWHWGFAAAGIGMTLGLIQYVRQQSRLASVGQPPALPTDGSRPWGTLALVALGSLALIVILKASDDHPALVYALFAAQIAATLYFAFRPDPASNRMAAILIFFSAAVIFWSIFEQAGSTISLFADQLTRNEVFGQTFPSSWWQSVGSIMIIVLAPVFAYLWIKLGSRQPSSPLKFVLGLCFVALSFVLMVPAAKLTLEGRVSPLWLVGLFFLQTVGELLISPVGLSIMTKLAPPRLTGLVMGIWFLALAFGNKLAGVLAGSFKNDNASQLADFFWHQALLVGVATLVLFALVPWMKKLMGGVK